MIAKAFNMPKPDWQKYALSQEAEITHLRAEREELVAALVDSTAKLSNLRGYLRKHEERLPPVSTSSLEVRMEANRALLAKLEGPK